MTELDRSDITVWFPWLTDLVFFGVYGVIGGINRWTRGQEWEMSIPRCAVIRVGTQTRVAREIRRLPHDPTPRSVADDVVTHRCDGTSTVLNKCVLCIVGDN